MENNIIKSLIKDYDKPKVPFLSVVIPCYNPSGTIERLLDTIVENKNNKAPSFEVILEDDNSDDDFYNQIIVPKYIDKLDIKYFKCPKDTVHCPSNTRLHGLEHVTGQWVTFIDQDDMYEKDAFYSMRKGLIWHPTDTVVITRFRDYDPITNTFGREYDQSSVTWLHGKFYNVEFLKKYKINFKENLLSNEDVYFNQKVLSIITIYGLTCTYMNKFTHRWVLNPDSVSRRMFKEKDFYIDKYYQDYIDASTEPWFDVASIKGQEAFKRLCFILLYAFFYYESYYMRRGYIHHIKNRSAFENLLIKIRETFHCNNDDIIRVIYFDNENYNRIRADALHGCSQLIEYESFYTFIDHF